MFQNAQFNVRLTPAPENAESISRVPKELTDTKLVEYFTFKISGVIPGITTDVTIYANQMYKSPIGSFKGAGAYYAILNLSEEEKSNPHIIINNFVFMASPLIFKYGLSPEDS